MTAEGQNLIDSSSIGDLFSFKRGIGFGLSVHQTTRKKHRLVGLGFFFFFSFENQSSGLTSASTRSAFLIKYMTIDFFYFYFFKYTTNPSEVICSTSRVSIPAGATAPT